MKPIDPKKVQEALSDLARKEHYIHLETTNGAYASHKDQSFFNAGAFIRNVPFTFLQGAIKGDGPYRIGLETEFGWLYAEGLTDWEIMDDGKILFAGHDHEGRLAIALQFSSSPFPK